MTSLKLRLFHGSQQNRAWHDAGCESFSKGKTLVDANRPISLSLYSPRQDSSRLFSRSPHTLYSQSVPAPPLHRERSRLAVARPSGNGRRWHALHRTTLICAFCSGAVCIRMSRHPLMSRISCPSSACREKPVSPVVRCRGSSMRCRLAELSSFPRHVIIRKLTALLYIAL